MSVEEQKDLRSPNEMENEMILLPIKQDVCYEYVDEIFSYIRSTESNFLPAVGYMTLIQDDINEKMRAILVD